MKKVAFLLCSETIGGHEYQAIEIVKTARLYCNPTVILNIPQHKELVDGKEIQYILSHFRFFRSGNFIYQYIFGIINRKRIRNLVIDFDQIVVCAGSIEAGISCGLSLGKLNTYLYVPMFVNRKELWGIIGEVYNQLFYTFLYPYKNIITINQVQRDIFSKYASITIVPNIISKRRFPHCNIKLGTNQTEKRLYFIGRLDKQKRVRELIKWLDSSQVKFHTFLIIGEGEERNRLEKECKKLKHIQVFFCGWLSPMEQECLLTSNDVFIINSSYEGDPMAIREANDRGSQVIARDILGHKESTYAQNRYRTKQELLHLLDLAYINKLKIFINPDVNEIKTMREKAIKQLFG